MYLIGTHKAPASRAYAVVNSNSGFLFQSHTKKAPGTAFPIIGYDGLSPSEALLTKYMAIVCTLPRNNHSPHRCIDGEKTPIGHESSLLSL